LILPTHTTTNRYYTWTTYYTTHRWLTATTWRHTERRGTTLLATPYWHTTHTFTTLTRLRRRLLLRLTVRRRFYHYARCYYTRRWLLDDWRTDLDGLHGLGTVGVST